MLNRINGQLVQRQLVDAPPAHYREFPSDWVKMSAAPEFYPDHVMNMTIGGGVWRTLQPQTNPVVIAANSTNTTILQMDGNFATFIIAGMALTARTTGADIGEYGVTYLVDARRKIVGQIGNIDANLVAMTSVFGTGRYPHYYSRPIGGGPNTKMEIFLQNREAFPVSVEFTFLCCVKDARAL